MPEPMFLLSDEEIVKVHREKVRGFATMSEYGLDIARAQLKKVAAYVKRHSLVLPVGTTEPVSVNLIERHVLYLGAEEWDALMREAGLDKKEAPDATKA